MKRSLFAALSLSLLLASTQTAHAASVGANFGFTHFVPKQGNGLSLIGLPNSNSLALFAPGLRVTMPIGTESQSAVYLDGGLSTMSASGNSIHMIALLVGYEYAFSTNPSAPYVTVGVGLNSAGGSGLNSVTDSVFGGGLGIRQRLANHHGSVRGEIHVDYELDSKNSANSLTAIGLKMGFDLDL